MAKKGNLFIVSAPSGCGKTTVVAGALKKLKNITRSVSFTTRPPRAGEKQKKDYYFISETAFKNKAKKGAFLEWAKTYGYYYGTPKKDVLSKLKRGIDVVLVIDVKGAAQIRRKMPECVMVFVAPPSMEALIKRLKKRATDNSVEIAKRLKIARKEISFSKKYDYAIINDGLKEAVEKLKSIIKAKRCEDDRYWNR